MTFNQEDEKKDKNIDNFYDRELQSRQQTKPETDRYQTPQFGATDRYGYPVNRGGNATAKKGVQPLNIIIIALVMVAMYFIGVVSYQLFNPDLMLIKKALDEIDATYYLDVDKKDVINAAANGMLQYLDPYSRFLSPEEYYALTTPESGTGISHGVRYYQRESDWKWTIFGTAVGSSSYKAGLTGGDVLVDINGTPIYYYTAAKEVSRLLSSAYSLNITVERDDKLLTVNSFAGAYNANFIEYYFGSNYTNMPKIQQELAKVDLLDNATTGYIRLTDFDRATETEDALTQFNSAMTLFNQAYGGRGKLVLNLKSNPGGYNYICYGMTGLLAYSKDGNKTINAATIKTKNDVYVQANTVESTYSYYFDTSANYPQIVMLTDGNSASASEMLLSALLDYGTAIQVGTKSYGKGISQTVVPLKAATITVNNVQVQSFYAVYLTFAKIYSPLTDVCIHGVGHIPAAENTYEKTSDQMERARVLLARR